MPPVNQMQQSPHACPPHDARRPGRPLRRLDLADRPTNPIPYHPANQFWPLQLSFLAALLTLAAALIALGWHATHTRAI